MEYVEELGPLGLLIGTWEGDKGADVAPAEPDATQVAESKYREQIVFEPTGLVDNHAQLLYGLRYKTTAWRIGEPDSFHEENGYWMWDAGNKQVMRCFIVPRGVTVLAGGTVEAEAGHFEIAAVRGSETYGICSNKFLDEEFRTIRYDLKFTMKDENTIHYWEDTVLQIKGQENLFHHTDENTLTRV